MVTQELIDYIKKQLEGGVSRDEIKQVLISNGWQELDINKGFAAVDSAINLAKLEVEPQKSSESQGVSTEAPSSEPVTQPEIKPEKAEPVLQPQSVATQPIEASPTQPAVNLSIEQTAPPASYQPQPQIESKPLTMTEVITQVEQSKKVARRFKLNKSVLITVGMFLAGMAVGIGLVLGIQMLKGAKSAAVNSSPLPTAQAEVSPSPAFVLGDIPYEDREIGIRFSYPSGWEMETAVAGPEKPGAKKIIFKSSSLANINIQSIPLSAEEKKKALDKVVDSAIALLKKSYPDYVVENKIQTVVGSQQALIVEGSFSIVSPVTLRLKMLQLMFFTPDLKNEIVITLTAPESEWGTFRPLYLKAIESTGLI